MTVHLHEKKVTADKHAKQLRARGLTANVVKKQGSVVGDRYKYFVYSYRK